MEIGTFRVLQFAGGPQTLYNLQLATERIAAAVQAARALPFHVACAPKISFRASRTIKRLLSYQDASADALSLLVYRTSQPCARFAQLFQNR